MNHTLQCIDLKLWFVNIFISWIDRLYVYLCTNILWDAIYVGIAFVLKNLHRFFYFSNTLTAHFILGWQIYLTFMNGYHTKKTQEIYQHLLSSTILLLDKNDW